MRQNDSRRINGEIEIIKGMRCTTCSHRKLWKKKTGIYCCRCGTKN